MEADPEHAAAGVNLSGVIRRYSLNPGFLGIPHSWKKYSVQSAAFDIIYTHPMNHGAATGRTALIDFLYFARSVSKLDQGVYLSLGSSVMSPMIFEKSISMAQNIEIQRNNHIDNHFMLVVDLAKAEWDWARDGEPPAGNPSYYLRYCKTFNRMGGEMHYLRADNRDFLAELYRALCDETGE
jgi:hypothetical protein